MTTRKVARRIMNALEDLEIYLTTSSAPRPPRPVCKEGMAPVDCNFWHDCLTA